MTSSTSSSYDYDYIVLGGGSGGVSSAKRAAINYGKKVAIVEVGAWGGTCVNVGCVPKKIMFQAAAVLEAVNHDAKHYEIGTQPIPSNDLPPSKLDWSTLKVKRDKYIQRLNHIYLSGLEKAKIDILNGWGKFVDEHTILVQSSDGTEHHYTAEYILIAVGGKPMIPTDTPGMEHCITSDGFFDLSEQPSKAAVIGAGYIAVELAGVLNALGTQTHLVVRKEKALRNFDPEVSDFLDAQMIRQGICIHRNTGGVAKVEIESIGSKMVTTTTGETIAGLDCVLMAPGRLPNTDNLGLDTIGIITNKIGEIAVDEYQTSNIPSICAVGDVCDKGYELTPMAIAAGRRLADRLFGNQLHQKVSYENVPTVVFSHPTIGTIGLSEPAAVGKYGADNLTIYRSTFVNLYYSMFNLEPSDKPTTFVKLICAGETEQVVGLHICGMAADEIMQGFGVAIKMGATKADFDACIAIHPTAGEEVVTLGTWGTSSQNSGAVVPPLAGASAPEPKLLHPRPASKM